VNSILDDIEKLPLY